MLRNSTAWEHIVIHPDAAAVAKLQNGYNSMQTRFGPTIVYWRLMPAVNGSHAFLETNTTIPVGSTAEIVSATNCSELRFLPRQQRWCCGQVHDSRLELLGCELSAVEESGQLLWATETDAEQATLPTGLASVAPADEGTVTRFGSGVYTFRAHYSC